MCKINWSISGRKIIQRSLYTSIVMYKNKMYFAPYSAHEIGVYDVNDNKFEKIKELIYRVRKIVWNGKREKFLKAVELRDKIWFIPYYYPGILCYRNKHR